MASSDSNLNLDSGRQRLRADGRGSAWESLNAPVGIPTPSTPSEHSADSSHENNLLTSASSETYPKSIFRPAPLLSSRSESFVNATPSGEVQIRDRIFGEKGVRDNLTNQRQSDLISVHRGEGIRGTQVPEGRLTSQVHVTNSDYTVGQSDERGRTAAHAGTTVVFQHGSSIGAGAETGQSASSFYGRVSGSETSTHVGAPWR